MTQPAQRQLRVGQRGAVRLADVRDVARRTCRVVLDDRARDRLERTRTWLLSAVDQGQVVYGVNTGFGALSETRVPDDALADLQVNLLRSHAAGVGPAFEPDVVRVLLALRAHTLALGASGVGTDVPLGLLRLLDADLLPVVPSQGSVGASGDLAPLAHLSLPLIGEGQLLVDGRPRPAADVLAEHGIPPLRLGPKEGLGLINGTQVTTAVGALAAVEATELAYAADVVAALSLDAQLGSLAPFDPRIHQGKPHRGQIESAAIVRTLVDGSPLNASHRDCGRVQDAYSLRCVPQVHGAVRNALDYVTACLETELDSFTDNPLVLARDDGGFDVRSGGNFHAATVALPLDHLAAAVTSLATISERRTDRFMAPETSAGLPPFLAERPGLESGFMMWQVTAAALASECKALAHPAATDSIPTSAGKEDHVSMGPIAARKARAAVDAVARCLAIEAAAAARALDLRTEATSERLRAVHEAVREHVAPTPEDRSMASEIESLAAAIKGGALRRAAGLSNRWLDADR